MTKLSDKIISLVPRIEDRPIGIIRLADVLIAIDIHLGSRTFVTLDSTGMLHDGNKRAYWSMISNLDSQSPQTKAFISRILGVTEWL